MIRPNLARWRFLILLPMLPLLATRAYAAPEIGIRWFGTAGLEKSGEATPIPEIGNQGNYLNFSRLTRFGINIHSTLSEDWTASAQFLADRRAGNLGVRVDWGMISWSPQSSFSVRAGRVIVPVWLYSQQINVGYTYYWVAPPAEVYGLNPITAVDGVSLIGRTKVGNSVLQAELVGGTDSSVSFDDSMTPSVTTRLQIRNNIGVELSYNLDDRVILRGSAFTGDAYVSLDSSFTVPASSPGYPVATQQQTTTKLDVGRGYFGSLGGRAELGGVVMAAEAVRRVTSGTSFETASAAYGTLGYRLGRFLPLFTYAWQGDIAGNYYLHPKYPSVVTPRTGSETWKAGLNYQLDDSAVLKTEYGRTMIKNLNPAQDLDFGVFRASVDFAL